MINKITGFLFGTKKAKCEKCGVNTKLREFIKLGIDSYLPYPYNSFYVCEICAKAIRIERRIENKEYNKRRKEEREKEIETWIKERDKILKSEESD